MNIKKITVAGGGVLGSQIAFQAAFCGYDVKIWLRSEESIKRAQPRIEKLHQLYTLTLESYRDKLQNKALMQTFPRGLDSHPELLTDEKIDVLQKRAVNAVIELTTDMKEAFYDADLVIEAISERPDEKKNFYHKMREFLPEKTILCTNSSTLLPSMFAEDTGRPEKFLALHFANDIWRMNLAEVMGHPETDPEVYEQVVQFAKDINMVPTRIHKEQPGYVLNALLVPFLKAAQGLYVNGVADPEEIDKTWQIATGAPLGPFRILDIVGLKTVYNIVSASPEASDPESTDGKTVRMLKEHIEAGKLGVESGEGFYKYR